MLWFVQLNVVVVVSFLELYIVMALSGLSCAMALSSGDSVSDKSSFVVFILFYLTVFLHAFDFNASSLSRFITSSRAC